MLVTFDGNGEVQISSGRRRFVSGGLGSGLGEGLRAGQPPCGLGLGDAFQLPNEDFAPEASAVRRMCRGIISYTSYSRTNDCVYNGYDNINLEPNAMNNIDTVAHMNMHYTQY